ncbi:AGAP003803-PA [Anopheles gambiae str. PEST]|uniref:AGAP003803-PA n=1 Tax=Anopheles gambiae TaxID=7165 RepID=Q5TVA7_ANOGA|nr:AGAP003803-PA [Anopheles gambiae str. PEST]
MSVGVTVHDVDPLSSAGANPLADLEAVRKIANEKLRIRRLVQVREQSKQLAAKVRQNYQLAKEKELAKIEQTKRDEVNAWKRQQIRHLQDEYARSVCEVGEAHRAAEAAEECAVWFEEKRATQQAVALQRGKVAEANAARERERKEAEKTAKQRKKPYVPTKSIAVQASIPVGAPEVMQPKHAPPPEDCDTSSEPTPSPYEQFRARRNPSAMQGKPPPPTSLSESEDESAFFAGTGTGTRQLDKENIPRAGHEYSATAFTSPSDLRSHQEQPTRRLLQPFTQITELIQQRRQRQHTPALDVTRQPVEGGAYGYGTQPKTVQFDDLSDNTLSFPTSTVLTHDNDAGGPCESPRKMPPRKTVTAAKGVQQVATTVGSKRGKAVLPAMSGSSSTTTTTSSNAACAKVQYYDCNTMYRREYDQPVGYVQREERRQDDPTGMEEANRYELLQQELAKARSKPTVDRTKPALEKQQTRKDYEKLSKELDNLTRTENRLKSQTVPTKSSIPSEATLKQKAETRQRKANEAIEQLLQQRALVTCPIVQSQPDDAARRPTVRPSVVNVAETRYGSSGANRPERQNISTDSCASIVLDTFDRPGIPLPSEAVGGSGVDKIAKLKELLEQINEQRRLLTEDIAREKANEAMKLEKDGAADSEPATKQEIDRLERMKRRQEELLEQQQLLHKREREVEELGRQLEEKMALLQRNRQKQKGEQTCKKEAKNNKPKAKQPKTVHVETKGEKGAIDVEVVEPSSITSSSISSEVSKDSCDSVQERRAGDAPVKIIITVNEKATATKRKKKATVQQKTSPAKVTREAKGVEKVHQPAAAPEASQPIMKPLPSRKDTLLQKVANRGGPSTQVVDLSPGSSSTTSTVYRPLPPKIGSLKILQKHGPPGESEPVKANVPVASSGTAGPKYQLQKGGDQRRQNLPSGSKAAQPAVGEANLNPHLMKYIVRLLGMSRQSIDQLGVSTTSVSTPNESVVNVTSNVGGGKQVATHPASPIAPNEQEVERMHRLKKFIDENYNFLQEIDETLRRSDQSTLGSSSGTVVDGDSMINDQQSSAEADISRVEGIWMETLRRRERRMHKQQKKVSEVPLSKAKASKKQPEASQHISISDTVNAANMETLQSASQTAVAPAPPAAMAPPAALPPSSAPTVKEGSLKSILKSPKRDTPPAKVAKIITPQGHVEVINLSDREEQEILERYSQLTERCSQRITELSQMINQVREEKRRLIEDSLSSLEQQESTKYMDLPAAIGASAAGQPPLPSQTEKSTPPAVALSPPGAPAGSSAAPLGGTDDPVSEEIDNIISSKQIGLSKDSGIAMSRPLTASDIRESPSEEGSQGKEPLPFEPFLKDIPKPTVVEMSAPPPKGGQLTVGVGALRRNTPPVAIARFSPQLPDELPMHELSTIPEVDTPAVATTSRVNDLSTVSATTAADHADAAEQVLIEARNRLLFNEAATAPDIGYDRFPNYEEYVRSATSGTGTASFVRVELEQTTDTNERSELRLDTTEDRVNDRLAYRKFPGTAPAFDLTEDGEATLQPASGESTHKSASDTSLPDVVAELRKWNIIVKPFNNSLDNSNRSTPLSEAQEPARAREQRQQQQQPADKELPGPRPKTAQSRSVPQKETSSFPLQQLSDSFQRDLENVAGLRWGSSMLKRTQQDQQSSDSSPLSSLSDGKKVIVGPNDDTVANDADGAALGKPLNLAEFVMRELMVRSQSELQSLSSVSSSSHGGSHSTLLRSLLNLSRLNESNSRSSPIREELLMHTPTEGKSIQRTSTPVASKSTASGSSLRMGGDAGNTDPLATNRTETGLFSGESRLSSVHWSSSSGNSSDRQEPSPQQGRLTVPAVRLERQPSTSRGESA